MEPGWALAVEGVGLEYGSGSFALSSDYSTHLELRVGVGFWNGGEEEVTVNDKFWSTFIPSGMTQFWAVMGRLLT